MADIHLVLFVKLQYTHTHTHTHTHLHPSVSLHLHPSAPIHTRRGENVRKKWNNNNCYSTVIMEAVVIWLVKYRPPKSHDRHSPNAIRGTVGTESALVARPRCPWTVKRPLHPQSPSLFQSEYATQRFGWTLMDNVATSCCLTPSM